MEPALAAGAARSSLPANGRAVRGLLFAELLLWIIGTQTTEALATGGAVACLLTVAILARPEDRGEAARRLRGWWPLAAFLAWAIVVPWAAGHMPEGTGLARLSDWLALPAAAFAWPRLTGRQQRILLAVAGAVFAASSLAALLQYRGWWPAPEALRSLSWTRIPFDRVYEPVMDEPGRFYGGGFAFHRLKFANAGGLVIVAMFAAALRTRGRQRVLCVAVVVLGLLAIFVAAQARAASAALLLTLVVMAGAAHLRRGQLVAIALLLCVGLPGVALLSPSVRVHFAHLFEHEQDRDRRIIWSIGARAVESAPLAGVGLGRYRAANFAPPGTSPFITDHPGKAHNEFLSFAAEIGIPGAILFLVLLGWIYRSCVGEGRLFGRGAVLFFVLLSLFHDPLFHAAVSAAFVLAFGVGLGLSRAAPRDG